MMILSTMMKMLLWTLPGATLRTPDNGHQESDYTLLLSDLGNLRTNLAQENIIQCGEIYIQSNFKLLSEQFLRSVSFTQEPAAVSSAVALAELLSQIAAGAEDSIKTLLRGFIRVHRSLAEAAYVVPVSALPPPMREGRNENVLIIHAATRTPSAIKDKGSTNVDQDVTVKTLTLAGWEQSYGKFKVIQELLRTAASAAGGNAKRGEKTSGRETSVHGIKRPMAILEKHCFGKEGTVSNSSSFRDVQRREKEWRIMLAFLTRPMTKEKVSSPVFYVTLPLHSVDLNQCDDSPHAKIRGTHGCLNTTCVFTPGGGFEMGHYRCCCQRKNVSTISSSTFTWLEQQHQHHQLFSLEKNEQCFDGKLVEDERLHGRPFPGQCVAYFEGDYTLRKVLLAVNVVCALGAFALIFVVMTQRKVQDWGSRGWALMELLLLGAMLLYGIIILEFLQPQTSVCCLIVWCRELGFALFYGAIVLKIHRNLFEHRVRKAHHVYIKEKDLLKYLLCIVAFTVIGLVAWTVTAIQAAQTNRSTTMSDVPHSVVLLTSGRMKASGDLYVVCTFFHWNIVWHAIEFAFLFYGAYLSYKARNTTWNERRQFGIAVLMEMIVSMAIILLKNNIWLDSSPDTLILLSFIQVHLTTSVIIAMIMATKFYYASLDPSARAHAVVSSGPNKPHPSLAKLRDNLVNGTVDFAEVPIAEMNPEDIRAELKRVYTQLRMYKLTNLYMENPHISKRKGGKKTSSKQTNRRFSIPTVANKPHNKELKRIEADERSSLAKGNDDDNASVGSAADLTILSSPHNVYLSRTALAAAKKLQLDSDLSVRI